MSPFSAQPASDFFAPPSDDGQPCDFDCAFARAVRADTWSEEWVWCAHPAKATRLVHPGRACPRYTPRDAE